MRYLDALMTEIEEKRKELDEAQRRGDADELYARSLEFDRLVEQFIELEETEHTTEKNIINFGV